MDYYNTANEQSSSAAERLSGSPSADELASFHERCFKIEGVGIGLPDRRSVAAQ